MINNLDNYILNYYDENVDNPELKEMLIYSTSNGGKRFRPLLFLSLFDSKEYLNYISVASAIELTHTYSLIHDDLPSMDNDLYRRGKKSLWNMYGENNAVLIGDSLITISIDMITNDDKLSSKLKVKIISELIKRSGVNGMITGQYIDCNNKVNTKEELKSMYKKKTGEMLGLPLSLYAIINNLDVGKFYNMGENLGILFQYQDDMLEQMEGLEQSDSDIINEKKNSIILFDNLILEIDRLSKWIINEMKDLEISNNAQELILKIINRGA